MIQDAQPSTVQYQVLAHSCPCPELDFHPFLCTLPPSTHPLALAILATPELIFHSKPLFVHSIQQAPFSPCLASTSNHSFQQSCRRGAKEITFHSGPGPPRLSNWTCHVSRSSSLAFYLRVSTIAHHRPSKFCSSSQVSA